MVCFNGTFRYFELKIGRDYNGTNHKCALWLLWKLLFCNWNEANDVHVCVWYFTTSFHTGDGAAFFFVVSLSLSSSTILIFTIPWIRPFGISLICRCCCCCWWTNAFFRFLSTSLKHIIEMAIKCERPKSTATSFSPLFLFEFFFISFNIFDELKLPFYNFIALQQAITLSKRLVNDTTIGW